MRILAISNYFPPFELGGWGQLTRDVCERLAGRGHEIFVLTSNYRAEETAVSEPTISRSLHLESYDHARYHPVYSLKCRREEAENSKIIEQTVTRFRPDLIYINGMWNMPHSVAQAAETLLPGRVVYYMASYWPAEQDAHTAFWQDVNVRPVMRLPKRLVGAAAQSLLIPGTPRNRLDFRLVLCVSDYMRRQIIARAGLDPARTLVVHNGIELDLFTMRDAADAPAALHMIYAGRLSDDKGVHTAIAALAKVQAQAGNSRPITLSILGSGTAVYEQKLRDMVQELGLETAVTFLGRVPRDEMPAILAEHNVLLFPSIWPEPLARMVQEAMACGLVVIGTTTGGTPEILTDGQNGLTFEADNPASLAEKIVQLAEQKDLWTTLAQNARQTVEARFSLERMIDELEAHFSQIVLEAEGATVE